VEQAAPSPVGEHHWRYRVDLRDLPLLPGSYILRLHALDPEGLRLFDTVERGITIRGQSRQLGSVRIAHHWS